MDEFQRLVDILIERNDADIGMRLGDDVGEELITRALRLEPDPIHPEQHRFQTVASGVARVDDRQAEYVTHYVGRFLTLLRRARHESGRKAWAASLRRFARVSLAPYRLA